MAWLLSFWSSAVGKKAVMAVSGIVLFGFVLVHMLGNLKVYQGPQVFNHYAEGLRDVGAPFFPHGGALWVARIVLLGCVALHMLAAYQLTIMNWRARPIAYEQREYLKADYAARTMRWGGVILGLFVLFHLAHLTFGARWAHPGFNAGDAYHNVVTGFGNWIVSAFYILAQIFLGMHIYHGAWSLFQSLGWNHPQFNHWRVVFAHAFAWIIAVGNISFPLAVMTGVIY